MKKRILIFILFILLIPFVVSAFKGAGQSEEKTTTATVVTGSGVLHGLIVMSDGTNAITIDGYDNTAAAGKKLFPTWTVTTSASNRAQSLSISPPVNFSNGVHIVITCAGTVKYMVYYNRK